MHNSWKKYAHRGMCAPKFTRVVLTDCFGLELDVCVHGDAAGHFEASFGFALDCNAHINFKATFRGKKGAL